MYRIGIDVGGTFTDLVAVDEDGRVTLAKAASTPADQSLGVLEGLQRLADALGLELRAMLARTERIVHGTTVATNTLLEGKGASVGLLTTEGHRDVLEMREGLKDDRYDLRQPPPEPLVPRELRLGVRERLRADGRVETALDQHSLDEAIAALRRAGASSVAVCYLHAWRDGRHERLTGEAVRAAMPEAHVSLSCEVLPQIKEYERVCTTVVNAYVGPALAGYLGRLETRLREAGFAGPILIMQSHGGVATIADSMRLAAGAVLSGPAGGVAAGQHVTDLVGERDLVLFDMGGTSTDVSLVADCQAQVASDRRLAGQRVGLQALDIVSVGALHVGPESAGADPGPACYGKGGAEATVTDANLVLGLLDPDHFLGGSTRLDRAAAEAAVDRIAEALGVSRLEAADGIHRIVNTRMAEGIRLVSVRRGVDPRRFALLAFGGAAALHVTAIARQLELARVVVPHLASVLSAWGMLASDLRYEIARSHVGDTSRLDADALRALYAELETEGRRRLADAAFAGEVLVRRAADMRYGEQIFEVGVDLSGIDWQAPDLLAQLAAAFHRRHEELYTYALPDQEGVLVNARVVVIGRLPALPQQPEREEGPPAEPRTRRRVWLGGWQEAPVFDLDALRPGQLVNGPAIVEAATTTTLLRPGDRARATEHGWLDITVARS
jgi:N-methylhydantoinase A